MELKAAADLLVATKKTQNCMGFKPGVGGKNDVVAGTAVAAIVYNGDAIQSVTETTRRHWPFVIPKEGSEIWLRLHVHPGQGTQPRCGPQVDQLDSGARSGGRTVQLQPVCHAQRGRRGLHYPEDLKNPGIYPTPEIMKTLHFTKDLGKDNRIMDEAWTRAKSH
jgi:spermidine/putrescine transport system substrate-binding protein